MTVPRAPMAVARAAVDLAVRPLPELDDRLRYRAQFTADLSVLPRLGQLGYAAGILTYAFVLRAALGAVPPPPRRPSWLLRSATASPSSAAGSSGGTAG